MNYKSLYKIFVMSDNEAFNKTYKARFNSESTYRFPFEINGNPAFFFFSSEIANISLKIKDYDKKVSKIFENLPGIAQNQYIKKSLIDEIEFTNQIEGVISTRKDINDILNDVSNANKDRLEGIVQKYRLLLDKKDIKFEKSQDVRNIYDEMLKKEISLDDINNLPDGLIFRKGTVHVYKGNEKAIHEGINPETKIIQYLDQILTILNDEDIDILIRVGIFHYMLGYIHPFYDGNGRINRFISSYYLAKNLTPIIGYRLSMTIKENLTQYLDAFSQTNDVRNKGDISTFVYEFLEIILKAYQKTETYALGKKQELIKYNKAIDNLDLSDKEKKILFYLVQCELFSEFGLNISTINMISEFSHSTVSKYLTNLGIKGYARRFQNGKRIFYSAKLENIK